MQEIDTKLQRCKKDYVKKLLLIVGFTRPSTVKHDEYLKLLNKHNIVNFLFFNGNCLKMLLCCVNSIGYYLPTIYADG